MAFTYTDKNQKRTVRTGKAYKATVNAAVVVGDLLAPAISNYRLSLEQQVKRGVSLRQYVEEFWQMKHGTPLSDAMLAMIAKEDQLLSCQRDTMGLAPVAGSA